MPGREAGELRAKASGHPPVGIRLGLRFAMNLRHHSLVAWQRADDLFIKLHRLSIERFPSIERYELGSQLRRAAFSVAVNIVGGFARRHRKARLNFLNVSESSLCEVWQCLHSATRLGYLAPDEFCRLEIELNAVGAPLEGLIRSTRRMPIQVGLGVLVGFLTGGLTVYAVFQ
jgi:four helix bundle protein